MIVVALCLLAADPAGAVVTQPNAAAVVQPKKARSILVMDLGTNAGIDPGTLSTITNTLAVSVQKRPNLSVLTGQDVKRMAQVEADKQVLGCDSASASCIAEIAGAMGADLVLYGDVGKLGDLFVINLNLFDAGQAKAVGRQTVQVKTFDESFIGQLDITVRNLLMSVTGEKNEMGATPTSGASVPTIDLDALKSSGLKSINLKAEKALEAAQDAQDNPNASPEAKRDAWCALQHVEGANAYLEVASKACADWTQYVVANRDLEKNMTADYQTLAGFLGLKHKSKEQKLQAIDSFLDSYKRLQDRPMVKNVNTARARLVATGSTSLDDSDNDGIPDDLDKCPNAPEDVDGFQDDDGCPDPDNDGDGIPDASDKCPNEKGIAAKDGCPETIGDVASKATSATGDFLSGMLDVIALDTKKDAYFGMGAEGWTNVEHLGNSTTIGGDFRVSWAAIEAGFGLAFDTDSNSDSVTSVDGSSSSSFSGLFFHLYGGLQLFQIPKGDFGLIRPSVGVDAIISPDDSVGGIVGGPYIANTFVLTNLFQARAFYRYEMFDSGVGFRYPKHEIGAELSVNFIELFK